MQVICPIDSLGAARRARLRVGVLAAVWLGLHEELPGVAGVLGGARPHGGGRGPARISNFSIVEFALDFRRGSSESRPHAGRLVLGCTEADFYK